MVEPVLDLFKIHRKMILGNPSIVVQNMLRIAPKPLNAVDMILAFVGKRLVVVQTVVLAEAMERVVAPEGVCIIHRSFSGMLSDMRHQLVSRHLFHDFGVYPAVALQKAKYNAFAGSSSATLPLPPAAEVRFINFDFAFQFACFTFSHMVDRFTQALVDAGHGLIMHAKIGGDAIRGLLLVEAGEDRDFFSQLLERFLFSAGFPFALYVPAMSLADLERPAENTLSAPQKVGRTVENVLFCCNHKGILALDGYESN